MTDYFAAIIDLILNSPDPSATLKRANELIDLVEDSQIQIFAVQQTEQRAVP